jgi:hypothetical protein
MLTLVDPSQSNMFYLNIKKRCHLKLFFVKQYFYKLYGLFLDPIQSGYIGLTLTLS